MTSTLSVVPVKGKMVAEKVFIVILKCFSWRPYDSFYPLSQGFFLGLCSITQETWPQSNCVAPLRSLFMVLSFPLNSLYEFI
jgi:hypothetical protein